MERLLRRFVGASRPLLLNHHIDPWRDWSQTGYGSRGCQSRQGFVFAMHLRCQGRHPVRGKTVFSPLCASRRHQPKRAIVCLIFKRQAWSLPKIAALDSIFTWIMRRAVSTWDIEYNRCMLSSIDSPSRVFRLPAPLVNFRGQKALLSLEVFVTSVHSLVHRSLSLHIIHYA